MFGQQVGSLFNSPVDLAPGAAISYIGTLYAGPVSNLVDGNNTSIATLSLPSSGIWIFDFTRPRSMWRASLGLNGGTHVMYCKIVYSDDGVTWFDTNQDSIIKNIEAAITDYALNDCGPHRFWGVADRFTAYPYVLQFTTISFYERVMV